MRVKNRKGKGKVKKMEEEKVDRVLLSWKATGV